ncbi:Rv3654c family TadE-like protein [Natronoglycomyces albus]|uniref:Flp pilus-assembly TadE/G-like family protein n=1 Tax=Natronoglycomyces albus TaxID=2811108 RepID=A0A895XI03_9ACTN|nr:Rv3654c family TadE-like protein [Natronoglycomyces albus]QSB05451.1 flp pilus-assembly TadE/G-like family protein [Natronoglycomyces albus]
MNTIKIPGRHARHSRGGRLNREEGSASVVLTGVLAVIVILAAGFITVSNATVARHQAQGAADVAALAGARVVASQPDSVCDLASNLAAENAATLYECRSTDFEVIVRVSVEAKGAAALFGPAHAVARAGPTWVS